MSKKGKYNDRVKFAWHYHDIILHKKRNKTSIKFYKVIEAINKYFIRNFEFTIWVQIPLLKIFDVKSNSRSQRWIKYSLKIPVSKPFITKVLEKLQKFSLSIWTFFFSPMTKLFYHYVYELKKKTQQNPKKRKKKINKLQSRILIIL